MLAGAGRNGCALLTMPGIRLTDCLGCLADSVFALRQGGSPAVACAPKGGAPFHLPDRPARPHRQPGRSRRLGTPGPEAGPGCNREELAPTADHSCSRTVSSGGDGRWQSPLALSRRAPPLQVGASERPRVSTHRTRQSGVGRALRPAAESGAACMREPPPTAFTRDLPSGWRKRDDPRAVKAGGEMPTPHARPHATRSLRRGSRKPGGTDRQVTL